MLAGDRQALAKLFSCLENDFSNIPLLMKKLHPYIGRAYCIGVTGPPGAGKSTLVDGLVQLIRGEGLTVGVLAVDPTSQFSGGAILGDRIRMKSHYLDEGVFIRSLASRGAHGGLSMVTRGAVKLMDAFGVDLVLVESVGVGQTELDVVHIADTLLVVLVPEMGDAVQALKAGVLEVGDVFAVNKADREGSRQVASIIKVELRESILDRLWSPPVLLTRADKGEGLGEVHKAINKHREDSKSNSDTARRRCERREWEFAKVVSEVLEAKIVDQGMQSHELSGLLEQVKSGNLDPYTAAEQALSIGKFGLI